MKILFSFVGRSNGKVFCVTSDESLFSKRAEQYPSSTALIAVAVVRTNESMLGVVNRVPSRHFNYYRGVKSTADAEKCVLNYFGDTFFLSLFVHSWRQKYLRNLRFHSIELSCPTF